MADDNAPDDSTGTGRTAPIDPIDPSTADADRLPVGARVRRYIVLDVLGEGGMGTVYAAYDPSLDRKIALKVLQRGRLPDADRAVLLGEAKTLAKLRHAHVLAVHDLGAMEDGRLFMTTDLIDGSDAGAWARAARRTWREVRDVFVQAGRGLAAVHRAGLVHRDLKPSNILVDSSGHACVADFGIAVANDDDHTGLAGTRVYMAPELSEGVAASPASDQCAFGLALHELLHGHRRGERARGDGARRVPRFLRAAIARMTASDPAARFPDMDAAVRAIAVDPGRRAAAIALGAVVLATAVTITVAVRGSPAPPPCEDDAELLAGSWDPERRTAVQAALTTGNAASVDEALAGLDSYAQDWRAARRDACLATRVRHDQTEDVLTLRMECLGRRRGALDALVDALARAGKLGARDPVRAVNGLPSVVVCSDVTLLRARVPLPHDPGQQREIAALEAELDAINAQSSLDQLPADQERVRAAKVAGEAKRLDAPHVLARALYLRATGETGATQIRTLQDSVVAAQAARDYERFVVASQSLAVYTCNAGQDPALVAELARASYEAAGRPRSLEEDVLWLEGSLGLCTSRAEVSIAAFSRIYELNVVRDLPARRGMAASAATNVASAYSYEERHEQAVAWSQKAVALTEPMYANSHQIIGHYMAAWTAILLGDHALALGAIESTERKLLALGDRAGELGCYLPMTRGLLLLARDDDRANARRLLDEAAACVEPFGASESLIALFGLRARTELALARGDAEGALALARVVAKIMATDPADKRNAIAHALVARALVALNRTDEAAAELARAEPFLAKDDHHDERWAMTAFARAELQLARGDGAGAVRLATEARELRSKRKDAFHVAELDALLSRARARSR